MKLKVLESGSRGNSYILENDTEALLIEAGVPFKDIVRHVEYKKIVGCIVSHEHKDHAKYLKEYLDRGISYLDNDWLKDLGTSFGGFRIKAFVNYHNVPCFGYLIYHKDMGNVVFSTDTGYIEYTFKGINHWLVECNYSKEILDQRVEKGFNPYLADRIVNDHMSLATCKEFFLANDLLNTRNIVLLHLSDSNSNAEQFQSEIGELTKKATYIAEKGLEIDLNLIPF